MQRGTGVNSDLGTERRSKMPASGLPCGRKRYKPEESEEDENQGYVLIDRHNEGYYSGQDEVIPHSYNKHQGNFTGVKKRNHYEEVYSKGVDSARE